MTVNPDAVSVNHLSTFAEKRNSFLRAFADKVADAGLKFLEGNPWGVEASPPPRPVPVSCRASAEATAERSRPPIVLSCTPGWGVELNYYDEELPPPLTLTTSRGAPVGASGQEPNKREFTQFLMTKVNIPETIAETFVYSILPIRALENVVIDETNKTFTLTLDHDAHVGSLNDVPAAGISLLNGSTVTMKKVIRGTYNEQNRSVDFESGAFTLKGGWKFWTKSTSILGFQIVSGGGQDGVIVKTGVMNFPATPLSQFPNTFAHLSWS